MGVASITSGIIAFIGLLTWGIKYLVSARERTAGRNEARLDASEREINRAKEHNKIEADVNRLDANELERELSGN